MKRVTLLAVLLAILCMGATQEPPLPIRFYMEGTPSDGEKFVIPIELINPPRKTTIGVIPLLTEKEIVAFQPFEAPNGTMGAYFKLDNHGTKLLEAFTLRNRGRVVVAMVGERQVIDMVADKPISDGVIVIASGLTTAEVDRMRGTFRLIGKEEDAKQKQNKKVKRIIAGDFDATEDPERGPSQATPTPIPAIPHSPSPTATPKKR